MTRLGQFGLTSSQFEVLSKQKDQVQHVISKWDLSRGDQLIYVIDKSVPEIYHETIKKGVLAWNAPWAVGTELQSGFPEMISAHFDPFWPVFDGLEVVSAPFERTPFRTAAPCTAWRLWTPTTLWTTELGTAGTWRSS